MNEKSAGIVPKTGSVWVPTAVLVGVFWLLIFNQQRLEWTVNAVYSYGWAVPFLATFLFYLRWIDRPAPAGRSSEGLASRDSLSGSRPASQTRRSRSPDFNASTPGAIFVSNEGGGFSCAGARMRIEKRSTGMARRSTTVRRCPVESERLAQMLDNEMRDTAATPESVPHTPLAREQATRCDRGSKRG